MAFGIVFSSIISGLSLAIWALAQGYSIPFAVFMHMLGGTLGAMLFMAFALLRPSLLGSDFKPRQGQSAN
ncbi:hypothetical protein [Rhodobacter sp. NSM]|uniref:hypothetical protein n=1 Tax=Rhodobacter sp. NSM TaxID=3457501 RepID=UPI003FD052CD